MQFRFYFKIVICEMKKSEHDKKSNVREKNCKEKNQKCALFYFD